MPRGGSEWQKKFTEDRISCAHFEFETHFFYSASFLVKGIAIYYSDHDTSALRMSNFTRPVASSIGGVDFGFLSEEHIKAISVKQIYATPTFDSLNQPIPGGLYDPALGAWGDYKYAPSLCYFSRAEGKENNYIYTEIPIANSLLAARHAGKVYGHVLAIPGISKCQFTSIMLPSSISYSVF